MFKFVNVPYIYIIYVYVHMKNIQSALIPRFSVENDENIKTAPWVSICRIETGVLSIYNRIVYIIHAKRLIVNRSPIIV